MRDHEVQVEIAGEPVVLLPERAMWWPGSDAVLIADPHFGKADTFRRSGVPVPTGVAQRDLARLSDVLARTSARRLVVLGDFYHARPDHRDAAPAALRQWREQHAGVAVTVIIGNHDVHAGPPAAELRAVAVAEGAQDGPFVYRHHPHPDPRGHVLAGHVHPCVSFGRSRFGAGRLPCFHLGADVTVLPAFGGFTGVHPVRPAAADRVFAVADGAVVDVTPAASRRR